MSSLLMRQDVIVVASVSCIYGLGSPDDYRDMMVPVRVGDTLDRDEFLRQLVGIHYERNDIEFTRGKFRVRGDVVEVYPAYLDEEAVRVEFFGDEIDRVSIFRPLTGTATSQVREFTFYPAKQFVTPKEKMAVAIREIRKELAERIEHFEKNQQYLEAQRIKQRTEYDIEMMQEMGFCQGIENYSRHLTSRPPGSRPGTLIDFFPPGFLTVIDESHVSIPQIGGMYEGDRSRKHTLVDFGFRLPSALDNRPLRFEEFMQMTGQRLYVSATPARFEIENSVAGNTGYIPHKRERIGQEELVPARLPRISGSKQPVSSFHPEKKGTDLIVEQIIRPTGLLDPVITLRPLKGQIDETIELCRQRVEKDERVLVTTLTKRTAEDLTDYLRNVGLRVRYIHADVDAIERVEILRSLRGGEFDILVGINLLREGLDLPEVSLVCILDADKEGFLRSETSLIQTVGRAARHVNGEAVLFADTVTDSIQSLLGITEYRRRVQHEHNEAHGIIPRTVSRNDQGSLRIYQRGKEVESALVAESGKDVDTLAVIRELEEEMQEAASKLEFERAALIRDQINQLKEEAGEKPLVVKRKRVKY
jgi:excinuclease ABC subunit B